MKTNSISAGLAVHARTTTTRHHTFRRACLWTGCLVFATIALGPPAAQAAITEAWVQRYRSEAGSADYAHKVVTDAAGNVIVAGYTDYRTGLIIKYSGAGVPLWTNRHDSSGHIWDPAVGALAVDASGNLFVTGYSIGTGGNRDYATIAYSGAGVPLWTNRYNGPANGDDKAFAVAVDGSGNVFVTGYSEFTPSGGDWDYVTIAYSGAGVPLWTNRYDGPGNSADSANAVAADADGNVFVTGYSIGSGGDYDYATIAYSGAGVPLWTNRYDGPAIGRDEARAVAVDASSNVFVTGTSYDSGGNPDFATIAYSGAGVPLWTNRYNEPENGSDEARAVEVDGSGNVFVTGNSATIAYAGAGVPLWTNRCNVSAFAVAVDGSGNVFVTGESSGDSATIAYSGAGMPLWTNRYNRPENSSTTYSVAVDGSGNVFVTGSYFVTVKYVWQTEIAIQLLSTIPPKVNLTLSGAPNSSWGIERALLPTGPWTHLSTLLIGTNGSAQFQDTNSSSPAGFYRARQ